MIYVITLIFFCHLTKGNNFHNFLFASLDDVALPKYKTGPKGPLLQWVGDIKMSALFPGERAPIYLKRNKTD